MNAPFADALPRPEDMARSRSWVGRLLTDAAALPISFVYDGKTLTGIPQAWRPVATRRRIDANIIETTFEGSDPATGLNLRVECTEYFDYPVMEWVAWFTNRGGETAPALRDILVLDGAFAGAAPVLYHCNGDFYSELGYTAQETPIQVGETLSFAPNGGRPCDGAFPYYRIMFEGCGLSLAIGWPGQWTAGFSGVPGGVQVRAGQEHVNARLAPGESIRTPRMTVLSWTGNATRAVNLWRRWYLAHILPRPNGRPLQPLLAVAATDEGEEFTGATEANQLRYIERWRQFGFDFDAWWIDAGWYPCYNQEHIRKWVLTGSWEPDPERFPNGLLPIAELAAREGAGLLLWFEPERVRPGTRLALEHPEWLLPKEGSDNGLLYLGNPDCRRWLTDHVCGLIRDNGVRIYRQDFNFAPLQHWRQNEPEDRQGLNENLHVQGYLQYWDDLLERNPGLWIDSCASGGRRNDLETMRRSVPLHYTDYGYGYHPIKLAFHATLYEWIPYFKESTLSWDIGGKTRNDMQVDSYSFHCGMAAMLTPSLDIRRDDIDYALALKMVGIWRRAAGLLLNGDFYPLTPFRRSAEEWVAWQFDSPETGQGFLQGIRFPAAPAETLAVHPQGLRPDAQYVLENPETGEARCVAGEDLLRDGFTFELPPRSGAIWFYRSDPAGCRG